MSLNFVGKGEQSLYLKSLNTRFFNYIFTAFHGELRAMDISICWRR